MNEFLSELFQAVLIAAVPVVTVFVGRGIAALSRYFTAKTENQTAKKYLEDAADAVAKAVTYTNQVYVDTLKKSGSFTKENQKEALGMALEKATSLLTAEAISFLEKAYGDLMEYLAANIEAEVRKQKGEAALVMSAPVLAAGCGTLESMAEMED